MKLSPRMSTAVRSALLAAWFHCALLNPLPVHGQTPAADDFNPGADGAMSSLAVQADGKILVGGSFITLGEQPRNCVGRLNADGTLDSGFNPGAGGGSYPPVSSLAVQADGKILVGGSFTTLSGQPRNNVGRLNNTAPATQTLSYDGAKLTWQRGGTSPEVGRTTFDYSTDGVFWQSLGEGTRLPGGWQLLTDVLPLDALIRAHGYTVGNSSGIVESVATNTVLPPARLRVESVSGPVIRLALTGAADAHYTVQTTTNPPPALPWEAVMDLWLTNGGAVFGWTNAGEASRFFRAVER